jgi:hypothetical protein
LIFDLDNTITEWNSQDISAETRQWFEKVRNMGFVVGILSNNNEKRIQGVAEQLNVPYVFNGRKPLRRGYHKVMRQLEVAPEETVMLGDQIFTDIWGGNRMKLYTILIEPIHAREYWGTKITRQFEKIVLRRLKKSRKIQSAGLAARNDLTETPEEPSNTAESKVFPTEPKLNEKGVTLVEVLAGMLILILVLSLAGVRTGAAMGRVALEQEAERIAWVLREARQTAITTNQSQAVRFFVHNRQYQVVIDGQRHTYTLPAGIEFIGTTTFAAVGSVPTCTFSPIGAPNGGTVAIRNARGENRFVIVNPVAGRVRVDTKPPES